MMNTYLTETNRFLRTWLCDSSGGYKKGLLLGCIRVFFVIASIFLISTSSVFGTVEPREWYEDMAHKILIAYWLYYKENNGKMKCFVWIVALLVVGSGVTYAYVSKELASLTPEEEFVSMYVVTTLAHPCTQTQH